MGADSDLERLADRVMADHAAENSYVHNAVHDPEFWAELTKLGLARLTAGADARGSEATWDEAAAFLGASARHGVAGPFAENDLLAAWLLERAGASLDDDAVRTIAIADCSGFASGVPWAGVVDRVTVLMPTESGWVVRDLDGASLTMSAEPAPLPAVASFDVRVSPEALNMPADEVPDVLVEALRLRGSLARAIQMTNALERTLELCVEHVNTRTQFGRKLAKFQMIQHAVADLALEAAIARTAVSTAVDSAMAAAETSPDAGSDGPAATDAFSSQSQLAIAIARSVANHATSKAVRIAHQLHGAIGATNEHALPRLTGPMLSWRRDFGSPRYWDTLVYDIVADRGPGMLWDQVTQLGLLAPAGTGR